jgi:hypothetical protein
MVILSIHHAVLLDRTGLVSQQNRFDMPAGADQSFT